jgi:hypothetical protein
MDAYTGGTAWRRDYYPLNRAYEADPKAHDPDAGHEILSWFGYIPVAGSIADTANAVWYAAEGRWAEAGESLGFAVIGIIPVGKVLKLVGKPLIKGAAKVAKILTKGAEEGSKAVKPAAKATGKALAKDTAESGGKKAAKGAGKDAAEGGGKSAKPAESSHGGGGPKGCNSFPGDTRVLLADGSTKPIAKVHIGDRVTNAKPDAHATQKHRVDGVIRTTTDHDFVQITLQDGQGQQKITATAHHRFWDHSTHRWTEATDLKPGDRLQTTHGTTRITTLTRYTKPQIAYNLTIRNLHTYYVLAGQSPVLVHNCGGNVALGTRAHGLRKFADENGYTHFLDSSDWQADVRAAVNDSSVHLHIRLDGFSGADPAEKFMNAYKNGMSANWYATEWEMYKAGLAVRVGNRSWSSITFYHQGEVVHLPLPTFPMPTG